MIKSLFTRFSQGEQGQDLVEYALLIAFISLAAVTVLGSIGGSINNLLINSLSAAVAAAPSSIPW